MRKYILPTLIVLGLLSPIVVLEAAVVTHPIGTDQHEMRTHYQLLAFFEERAPHPSSGSRSEGKFFNEIEKLNNVKLKSFILDLFPTIYVGVLERSKITPAEIDAIRNSSQAMHNYKLVLQKTCECYGMTYDMETGVISHPAGFKYPGRMDEGILCFWVNILRSLEDFSMLPEAKSLLANIEDIYNWKGFWRPTNERH